MANEKEDSKQTPESKPNTSSKPSENIPQNSKYPISPLINSELLMEMKIDKSKIPLNENTKTNQKD
jgi:hypothetical protein